MRRVRTDDISQNHLPAPLCPECFKGVNSWTPPSGPLRYCPIVFVKNLRPTAGEDLAQGRAARPRLQAAKPRPAPTSPAAATPEGPWPPPPPWHPWGLEPGVWCLHLLSRFPPKPHQRGAVACPGSHSELEAETWVQREGDPLRQVTHMRPGLRWTPSPALLTSVTWAPALPL